MRQLVQAGDGPLDHHLREMFRFRVVLRAETDEWLVTSVNTDRSSSVSEPGAPRSSGSSPADLVKAAILDTGCDVSTRLLRCHYRVPNSYEMTAGIVG